MILLMIIILINSIRKILLQKSIQLIQISKAITIKLLEPHKLSKIIVKIILKFNLYSLHNIKKV
jgi:hypothetical protein